jgi:hypothetical protein
MINNNAPYAGMAPAPGMMMPQPGMMAPPMPMGPGVVMTPMGGQVYPGQIPAPMMMPIN